MKKHLCNLAIWISLLTFPCLAQAEILANYDFEIVAPWEQAYQSNYGLSVSRDTNADSAASFYQTRSGAFSSFDSGITPNQNNFKNHAYAFSRNTESSTNPAGMNYYHEFTVTFQNGEYTLDGLSFEYWVNNTANEGDFCVSVYSDLTGYGMNDELIQYDYIQQTNQAVEIQQVNLTGLDQIAAFQNLQAGDSVEFRMVYNDAFPSGFVHRVDDVVLTGTNLTAVPEPTAVSVLALCGLYGLTRRRRS